METKLIFAAIIAVAMYAGSTAVVADPESKRVSTEATTEPTSVVMKDGKLWLENEGKTELLDKEIKLGTSVVKPDGTVFLESGQIVILKEGDRVTADGKIVTVVSLPGNPGESQ